MNTSRFDLDLVGDDGLDVELWAITARLCGRRIKAFGGFYEEGQDRLRLCSELSPDLQTLVVNGMTGRIALRDDRVRERLARAGQPLRLRPTTDLVEFTTNGPRPGQFLLHRIARFASASPLVST